MSRYCTVLLSIHYCYRYQPWCIGLTCLERNIGTQSTHQLCGRCQHKFWFPDFTSHNLRGRDSLEIWVLPGNANPPLQMPTTKLWDIYFAHKIKFFWFNVYIFYLNIQKCMMGTLPSVFWYHQENLFYTNKHFLFSPRWNLLKLDLLLK